MRRLWATSLTATDLEKAWTNMKKIEAYKNLSLARALRTESDGLVGMNATRAYSIVAKARLPIGRVLTSTLALIVKTRQEVENYKESFFYQLKGTLGRFILFHISMKMDKFENKTSLEGIKLEVEDKLFQYAVLKMKRKRKIHLSLLISGPAKGS